MFVVLTCVLRSTGRSQFYLKVSKPIVSPNPLLNHCWWQHLPLPICHYGSLQCQQFLCDFTALKK